MKRENEKKKWNYLYKEYINNDFKDWNQYYYAKMDDDTLFAILNKRIKEFKSQQKLNKLESDFT